MRWAAPEHTTEVFTPSGPVSVKDGFAELADDAPAHDVDAMRRAGFTLAQTVAPAPTAKATAPAQDKE